MDLMKRAMPAMSPPPPTGTMMASRNGFCSSISTATVPAKEDEDDHENSRMNEIYIYQSG